MNIKISNNHLFLIIFIIITVSVIGLYAIAFPIFPSHESIDWANFASYFSGIVTPVISIFGAWILLSDYIKKNSELAISQNNQIEEKNTLEKEKLENISIQVITTMFSEIILLMSTRVVIDTDQHKELNWKIEEYLKKQNTYVIQKISNIDDISRIGTNLEKEFMFLFSIIGIIIDKYAYMNQNYKEYIKYKILYYCDLFYSEECIFANTYIKMNYSKEFLTDYEELHKKICNKIEKNYFERS